LRRGDDERPSGCLEITTDITERKRHEEQLRQAAKLESLGVLAGGIAHDFNNLLVGIMGNASLALDSVGPNHSNHGFLEQVIAASQQAADLTRQLLAYAGRGRFVLQLVNLSDLVRELCPLIEAAIPKHVQLRLDTQPDADAVEADVSQLQQVVMNLVINAAEAMGPAAGVVTVSTRIQDVDKQYLANLSLSHDLPPGRYALLEVHDNGCGMNESTMVKIFDPFFTTKFQGRGLGLAAVQGIVRGHRGGLKVYSTPGLGSTFKVLLPAVAGPAAPRRKPGAEPDSRLQDTGMLLVIDDEPIVRSMATSALERYGYTIKVASNGREGIDVFKSHQHEIRLVLLDLTMPVMNGEEALRELQSIDPDVRVVLSSGFSEVEAIRRFAGKRLAGFVQKPYTAAALARTVKQVLDPDR
jgi:nitrogen-specific signal transduction histidine kinase/CheY-like chemotaxis protein